MWGQALAFYQHIGNTLTVKGDKSMPYTPEVRIARALEAMFGLQPSNREPLIRIARALESQQTTLNVLVKVDDVATANVNVTITCEELEQTAKTNAQGKAVFAVSTGTWLCETDLGAPDYYDVTTATVSVSVGEAETATLTAKKDELSSIAVKTNPTTTTYVVGDDIDPTGLVITATYKSERTADIDEGYEISPTTAAADTTAVTVSYTEGEVTKTTTYSVTVTES